jgi:methionyl-tRNA formyltransferase
MKSDPRIVFAGSPGFALPTLAALVDAGRAPCAVLTQPDRPAGRGRVLTASPVKNAALELGIPVLQPVTLKSAAAVAEVAALAPDLLVVVAYGLLLPPALLECPRRGCVNVHASILPRWRGASPVQAAILHGDTETGVSIMAMDRGLDTGPVYAIRRTPIGPQETAAELEARLGVLGAATLAGILPSILDGSLEPEPQPATGATYAGRISKADGVINWSDPAVRIHRMIRAYNPWPVAETLLDGQQLRCFAAATLPARASAETPGTIIGVGGDGIEVCTGDGLLQLTEIQLPGRQRGSAANLARGRPLVGKILG